jgi:FKBP-type peptidyl-prolyl cis-trans isomerase
MATNKDRIFALVMAITFAVTTVGVSAAFVWQLVQEERKKDNTSADQTELSSQSTDDNKDKLQGKAMQDFTPVESVTELKVEDRKVGDGQEVKAGDTVTVDYTGALAKTGVVFQSSLDSGQPVTFGLDGVIAGWTEGVPGMKVGGTRRLYIPAAKAYGEQSRDGIPANSDLVFDITLHKIGE